MIYNSPIGKELYLVRLFRPEDQGVLAAPEVQLWSFSIPRHHQNLIRRPCANSSRDQGLRAGLAVLGVPKVQSVPRGLGFQAIRRFLAIQRRLDAQGFL